MAHIRAVIAGHRDDHADEANIEPVTVVQYSRGGDLFVSQMDRTGFGNDAREIEAVINLSQRQARELRDLLSRALDE